MLARLHVKSIHVFLIKLPVLKDVTTEIKAQRDVVSRRRLIKESAHPMDDVDCGWPRLLLKPRATRARR